jgi:hypothetical protein
MNNDKGIIYLLQPAELVGTNHYKIGCSKKNNLDRLKSYKIGTRYIDIRECSNPHDVETKVKDSFKNKFTLVAGTEYFKGNEIDIKKEFNDVISDILYDSKLCDSKLCDSKVYDSKVCNSKVCDACDNTGTSYWSDGIYGNCMMCCCVECGEKKKFCTCITCDKCDYRINPKDNHQCKLCTICNTFQGTDIYCDCGEYINYKQT